MLVKFLKSKYGGGLGAVNYCLNQRVNENTARILKGNELETRAIISNIPHKQKVEFGVLSFENGAKITEQDKYAIMQDFENTLLGNMKDRVNILWVEHTDKNRLELNFIIPKIDLESGKSYTPYFYNPHNEKYKNYTADAMKINLWCEKINYEYNLEQPNDPKNKKAISTAPTHKQFKTIDELNQAIKTLVDNELLNSRDEIIDFIKSQGIAIKTDKQGNYPKNYLAVKFDDTEKFHRLKSSREGLFYDERFTNQRELKKLNGEMAERINQYSERNAELIIADNRRKIAELIRARDEYNEKRYIRTTEKPRQSNRANARENAKNEQRDNERIQKNRASEYTATDTIDTSRNSWRNTDISLLTEIDKENENDTIRKRFNESVRTLSIEISRISKSNRDENSETQSNYKTARARNIELRATANRENARTTESQSSIRERIKKKIRELRELARNKAIKERIESLARDYQERIRETANTIRDKFNQQFGAIKRRFRELIEQRKELQRQKTTFYYYTNVKSFDYETDNSGRSSTNLNKVRDFDLIIKSEYELRNQYGENFTEKTKFKELSSKATKDLMSVDEMFRKRHFKSLVKSNEIAYTNQDFQAIFDAQLEIERPKEVLRPRF